MTKAQAKKRLYEVHAKLDKLYLSEYLTINELAKAREPISKALRRLK